MVKATEWITVSVCGFICSAINISLLYHELKIRKLEQVVFSNILMKYLPVLLIVFALMYSLTIMTGYWPLLCYISSYLVNALYPIQGYCATFYQLSRLYHCFAKLPSGMAYSKWIFIVMTGNTLQQRM